MIGDKEFADKLRNRVAGLGLEMPKSIEPKTEDNADEAEEE